MNTRILGACTTALLCSLAASTAWAGYRVAPVTGSDALEIGALLQVAHDLNLPEEGDANNALFIRRARLDFQGALPQTRLTYRLQTEFARRNNPLLDAWVETRLGGSLRLRVGLDLLPHHVQYATAPFRLAFTERSITSDFFSHPGGRDVGVSLRGDTGGSRWSLTLADGSGAMLPQRDDIAFLLAGRYTRALLGPILEEEISPAARDFPIANVGVGFLAGMNNGTLGLFAAPEAPEGFDPRAHFGTGYADLRIQVGKIAVNLDGAFRYAMSADDDADLDPVLSWGFNALAGYLIQPDKIALIMRFGLADPNMDADDDTEMRFGGGLVFFHRNSGHGWRTNLEYNGVIEGNDGPLNHNVRAMLTWSY